VSAWDAIVIGGGHNGLVALEIKVTRLSYVMSLMPPRIIRDLDLERHGCKLYPMGPAYQA
jgi:hypothetical protein